MMSFGWMGGFGWIGMIFSLVVLVGIVLLIVWVVRRFSSRAAGWNQPSGSQSPREILQTRYARGEITREQYQQMMNDLN